MRILFALLLLCTPALAQGYPPYGGGPFRPDPRDWGPEERERRMPPPRGGYDLPPDVRDCIAFGRCRRQPKMPPFAPPPRYEDEGQDED